MGQVARCKGFVGHLMSNICEQRSHLSSAVLQLCELK